MNIHMLHPTPLDLHKGQQVFHKDLTERSGQWRVADHAELAAATQDSFKELAWDVWCKNERIKLITLK